MIREALLAAMMNANKDNNQATQESNTDNIDINKIKSDWNDFLSWMKSKGVQGKAELDKGDLGNKYFKQYIKENPQTSLNENVIPEIRKEYIKLRDQKVSDILSGKGGFDVAGAGKITGENAKKYIDRFMGHIIQNEKSQNPNYVGQHLTQTYFPGAEYNEYKDGKLVKKVKTEIGNVEDISNEYKQKNYQSSQNATKVATLPLKKQ